MILLLACTGDEPSTLVVETASPETCTGVGSGVGTLTTWCTSCHSAAAPNRYGAPEGVDFNTLDGARVWSDRIVARALDAQDMPVGGGIPESERARFAAWIACGMPGDDPGWPEIRAADTPDAVSERATAVLDDGGDLLLVVSWGGVERETLRFRKAGEQGFWAEEVYLDADGVPAWSRSFDPPIRVWDTADSWSEQTTATRDEGGVVTTADETWTVTRAPVGSPDARLRDQEAAEVVLTSSSGETYTWLLSSSTSFAERRRVTSTEEDVALGLTMPGFRTIEGFPVESGQDWAERGYTRTLEGE